MSKIGPELTALYNEYAAHLASSSPEPFRPSNPLGRVIDNRVLIDAVASGDVNTLKFELVSSGLQEAVAFGRIVSGQLPISAIPALAALQHLQFGRAASAITRGGGGSPSPERGILY